MGVTVWGTLVFQIWPSGVRKAKQKGCGGSGYRVGEPQEPGAGRAVRFSRLLRFLVEQRFSACCVDGKAGGQMFLSRVFIVLLLTAYINRVLGKCGGLNPKPNKPFEGTYTRHSWLVPVHEALTQNFLHF